MLDLSWPYEDLPVIRQAFVISDLHIGGGQSDAQLEDFEQDEQFVRFVDAISDPEIELIINGDFIDFAQIPPYEVPTPSYLLWTEPASLKKLETAYRAHTSCFEALARFIKTGACLRIIVGNHDLDFSWPRVQRRFREFCNGSTENVLFMVGHYTFQGVWIEHGHEFTPENCPIDPTNFIHNWAQTGQEYLERVWGTDFMLHFYNAIERRYPFADKVKPTVLAAFYGLRNGWVGAKEFLRFALFIKRRGIPFTAMQSALLADGTVTITSLVGDIADTEARQIIVHRSEEDEFMETFNNELTKLSADEKAILAFDSPIELGVRIGDFDDGRTLGIFRDSREQRGAHDRLQKPGVSHVVFGHTHEIVNGTLDGRLFNPGTWIPRMDLRSPAIRDRVRQQGVTLNMLSDKSLFIIDRLAVHIAAGKGDQAHVQLLEAPSLKVWS
jgi:UDP-2,3-diacylglucosamine pyrophosphatase LpxH